MAVDDETGSDVHDVAIAFDSTPTEESASANEPPRAARLILVVAALGVLALTLWGIVGGGDESTEEEATEPIEEAAPTTAVVAEAADDLPSVLSISKISASAHDGGTELVILDLGGAPPTRLVSGSPSLDRLPDDLLGLFIQRSPDPLLMCDASHSWGTTDDVGAVTLALPRAWFDVADGPIDVAIEGEVAGKIIVCALAGGGPVEITIHGPATLDRNEIEIAETPTGLAMQLGEGPPFDATAFPGEYAALIEGLEIFATTTPDPIPDFAATAVDSMRRSMDGDPSTVRVAHVGDEEAVIVWMAAGDREPYEDAPLLVCIGLIQASAVSASCQPPRGALAGTLVITHILEDHRRSVYLAPPDLAMRAEALGLPVDRGVVIIEGSLSDRGLGGVGLDGELADLEAES